MGTTRGGGGGSEQGRIGSHDLGRQCWCGRGGGGGDAGARATPAQPASGGGHLPQPRWAVCATGGGGGGHQGQTSREGERTTRAPQRTPHTNTSNPSRGAQVSPHATHGPLAVKETC